MDGILEISQPGYQGPGEGPGHQSKDTNRTPSDGRGSIVQGLLLLFFLNPITVGAGTLYLIGHLSRWFQLAEVYGNNAGFTGTWYSRKSVIVNGISFNRCIDIGENADYLFLQPRMLIDMVCKPVRIPWTAIQSVRLEKKLTSEMLRIQLSEPEMVLYVPRGILDMKNPYLALDVKSIETE